MKQGKSLEEHVKDKCVGGKCQLCGGNDWICSRETFKLVSDQREDGYRVQLLKNLCLAPVTCCNCGQVIMIDTDALAQRGTFFNWGESK